MTEPRLTKPWLSAHNRAMEISSYIGRPIRQLLAAEPVRQWIFTRTVETDLDQPLVCYEFKDRGVEIDCDEDEIINAVFLHRTSDSEVVSGVSFAMSRNQALSTFGPPSRSGEARHAPVDEVRPWDRFDREGVTLHLEYEPNGSAIRLITYMRRDVVPLSGN